MPWTLALTATACNSTTGPTKTVIISPPTIGCPNPISVVAPNGVSAPVPFGVLFTGGTEPVTTSCVPSGSFKVGTTTVTCTAVDAIKRSATCSFTVTVTPPPRLNVKTILAFGDSITEGEVPVAGEFALGFRPQFVELAKSYPADLTAMLAAQYPAQGASRVDSLTWFPADNTTDCVTDTAAPTTAGIVVINAGCLGEQPSDPRTLARLNDKLNVYKPDVVLLLEGVNDLNASAPTTSVTAGVQGVVHLIAAVRSRGIPVFVGTLPPEITMDLTHGGAPDLVPFFNANAQLVPAATAAGARVVDLYLDLITDMTDWVSPLDGLHLTEAGYSEVARVWFNTLRSAYELQPTSSGRTSASVAQPR